VPGIVTSVHQQNKNIDLACVDHISDEVSVYIVGRGPAGPSAAIWLKQLEQEKGKEVHIFVIEKKRAKLVSTHCCDHVQNFNCMA
jgi:2-polyprenyl-6-methoxyphenol hydroxylase-like FAD-dependent oxidoreductase